MTRYLISFDDGAMTFPEEELPEVDAAAHAVVRDAQDAGVWIFGGGLQSQKASVVATDGTVGDGPYPETKPVIGGFSILDVPSRSEALEWLPSSPSRADVRKRYGRSCTTRPSDRGDPTVCSVRSCSSAGGQPKQLLPGRVGNLDEFARALRHTGSWPAAVDMNSALGATPTARA